MLDLVRGYFTTSMALYPDEKRTWQELHHILLLQQMLEHFLKGWPVLFVFHLDSKVAHSDTVWILHLLQITEHSFTHRQGFINVNGAQVYKLRLVYCPNINRLHRFPLLGCDISWIIRDFRCDIWHCTRSNLRFLYNGIIIKHQKTEPTYTKTSLFLCEKRRFFMARREKGVVPIIYFEKERGKSF